MPRYGVLKGVTNTGADDELACVFAAPMSIKSNAPSFTSDTMTLRRVSVSKNVQRWEITAAIANTDDPTDFFVNNVVAGNSNSVLVRMPQLYRKGKEMPTGLAIKTTSNYGAGDFYVNLSGTAGTLLKGEFIRFANHNKVYMVADVGSNGLNVKLFPRLVEYVPTNTVVYYGSKVSMTAKYDLDTIFGITYEDGVLTEAGSFTFVEAL